MVPFAGWEMPVQYEGVRQEHVAVRTTAGLFDVSHMGEIETRGPRAADFLQHLLSNDIAKIEPRPARSTRCCAATTAVCSTTCSPTGLHRHGEEQRFLTVVNASNAESDFDWFRRQADGFEGVEVTDAPPSYAMLALQGPRGRGDLSAGCSRRARCRSASAMPRRRSRACRPSCVAPATPARTASSC